MFAITGNNFGAAASAINVNALVSISTLILNGSIEVDTTDPEYQEAESLELDLEGVEIPNSAPSAVLLTAVSNGVKVATIAKSQLVSQDKLQIEKVAAWDKFANYRIVFQCIYFPRGREFTANKLYPTSLSVSNAPASITGGSGQLYLRDEYFYIFMRFYTFSTENAGTPIELTITGADNLEETTVLLIYNNTALEADGSGYVEATIGNGKLTIPNGLPQEALDGENFKFFKGVFIR